MLDFFTVMTQICLRIKFYYLECKYKLLLAKIVHMFLRFNMLHVTIYI